MPRAWELRVSVDITCDMTTCTTVVDGSRYTFVEGVANPHSVTILIKGPSDHVIAQIKDAVRDGLRAVKNALDDKAVVPGMCLSLV